MISNLNHTYLFIAEFIILLVIETLYIRFARHHRIHEKITPRSSHTRDNIVKGAGFIFFISIFVVFMAVGKEDVIHAYFYPGFIIGSVALVLTSFIDDHHPLSPGIRLIIQFLIFIYVYYGLLEIGHPESFVLALICGIGFMNGYNFMDGINGMLASYSLVTLSTIYIIYQPLTEYIPMLTALPGELCICLIIAVLVFAIFNFRKNAICFSGDVGSIMLGYLIGYLTINYVVITRDPSIIAIVAVYCIDTGFTIIHRLFLGEDIFTSHRRHLYQLLANECGIPHLKVSLCYAAIQTVINALYISIPHEFRISYMIIVIILLSITYFRIRRKIRLRLNSLR